MFQKKRIVQLTSTATAGGTPEGFATCYVVEFATAWDSFEVQQHTDPHGHEQARIGTSFISFEQAMRNLGAEVGDKTQATLR